MKKKVHRKTLDEKKSKSTPAAGWSKRPPVKSEKPRAAPPPKPPVKEETPPKKRETSKRNELKIYGLHACRAIWDQNRERIIRAYVTNSRLKEMGEMLKWCASTKRAYHVVTDEELEKITASVHHDGVCILSRMPEPLDDEKFLTWVSAQKSTASCFLFMDGVGNPHNIGAIIRSCAHFGVTHILGAEAQLPALSPSASRIAEGGVEFVSVVPLNNPLKTLRQLRDQGYRLVATSSHEGDSIFSHPLPARTVLVMGAEMTGISRQLESLCAQKVQIPGTGAVESLNVSVATGIFLAEWCRQNSKQS